MIETVHLLNEDIPRPLLEGVTPADVHSGLQISKKEEIQKYYEEEQKKRNTKPWRRKYWDVLKVGLGLNVMTPKELLTKLSFFFPRPLRRIAKLNQEGVG